MQNKKQPTNREILTEIKGIKTVQSNQGQDIEVLLDWKKNIEIGKSAVDEYKKDEQTTRDAKQRREVMKQVGIVLGLIILVLYVYLSSHGVHIQ